MWDLNLPTWNETGLNTDGKLFGQNQRHLYLSKYIRYTPGLVMMGSKFRLLQSASFARIQAHSWVSKTHYHSNTLTPRQFLSTAVS